MKDKDFNNAIKAMKEHYNKDPQVETSTFWQNNLMTRINAMAVEQEEQYTKEIFFTLKCSFSSFALSLGVLICFYLSGLEHKLQVAQIEALLNGGKGIIF